MKQRSNNAALGFVLTGHLLHCQQGHEVGLPCESAEQWSDVTGEVGYQMAGSRDPSMHGPLPSQKSTPEPFSALPPLPAPAPIAADLLSTSGDGSTAPRPAPTTTSRLESAAATAQHSPATAAASTASGAAHLHAGAPMAAVTATNGERAGALRPRAELVGDEAARPAASESGADSPCSMIYVNVPLFQEVYMPSCTSATYNTEVAAASSCAAWPAGSESVDEDLQKIMLLC